MQYYLESAALRQAFALTGSVKVDSDSRKQPSSAGASASGLFCAAGLAMAVLDSKRQGSNE